MRKNIAVILEEIWSAYTKDVVSEIFEYFKDKDVNIIVSLIRLPNYVEDTFDYQYFSALKLLDSDEVDSAIFVSPTFCSTITIEEFEKLLVFGKNKKLISIGIPLSLPNAVSVQTKCNNTYDLFFDHMIKCHNAKRIAFLSAEVEKSAEAQERLDSYKAALKKHGMEYDESIVYWGRFVFEGAAEAFKGRIEKKEDVTFDTIFCANDMLALGCISYLEDLGYRVPEEIRVIGYDDVEVASTYKIPLTTIAANLHDVCLKACQLAEDAADGIDVKDAFVDTTPVFRRSCGCEYVPQKENLEDAKHGLVKMGLDREVDLNRIYTLVDCTEEKQTLPKLFKKMPEILQWRDISFLTVILYENPIVNNIQKPFDITEKCHLVFYLDRENDICMPDCSYEIDMLHKFWPDELVGKKSRNMIIEPIFYGNIQYGFIMSQVRPDNLSFLSVCIKVITNEIAHAYEYTRKLNENTKLYAENMSLNVRSYTDELTGLLNRRGFMHYSREIIFACLNSGKKGTVLYCDMDHLKFINDNYGHDLGDKAIKAQAEILRRTFRTGDLLGRIGGDEFVIIATGLSEDKIPAIESRMDKISEEVQKDLNLPFKIRLSIGGVPFTLENTDVEKLIQAADKKQYIKKEEHHRSLN